MNPTLVALLALCLCVAGCATFKDVGKQLWPSGQSNPQQAADKGKPLPTEFKSLKALAEKGDAEAQNNLGMMYDFGRGVKQDFKEAVKWYRKAAEQGDAYGQLYLGLMYGLGRGVEQDFKECANWYQKAADQGFADAQQLLGYQYFIGDGVEQNNVTAYAWWNIAATNGNQIAQRGLSRVAKEMTPEQITEAEALLKEMVKKNPKLLKK